MSAPLDFTNASTRRAYFAELRATLADVYDATADAVRPPRRRRRSAAETRERCRQAGARLEWLLSVAPPDVRLLLRGAP